MAAVSHASIHGDRRVKQLLTEMADRAQGIPPTTWAQVGDSIAGHMAEQFATEGSHLNRGKPWAPLKPAYLAWKIRSGLRHERLRATDAMRLSFVSRPMAVEEYRDMSATFGSDDEKAPYHQFGTRFMPQRQILNVEEGGDLADDVNSVLARYIFEERL
jgi:phage gpG-like protein